MAILNVYDRTTDTWFQVPIEDPTLYLLLDGTRSMAGNLNMGGYAIVSVGNVDGRDVSADGAVLDTAALLPGRAGGQTLQGGTAAAEDLSLESTPDPTKGKVISKDPHEFQKGAAYDAVVNHGSVSGTEDIDWTAGNIHLVAASGALTLTFTPPTGPTMLHLRVTAGAQAVTLPTIRWPGGDAPTFSTSNFDWLHILYDGTNYDGGFLLDYS